MSKSNVVLFMELSSLGMQYTKSPTFEGSGKGDLDPSLTVYVDPGILPSTFQGAI